MKKVIIFTKEFANRKKGDEFKCDSMLASHLVTIDKVAKYKTTTKKKVKES